MLRPGLSPGMMMGDQDAAEGWTTGTLADVKWPTLQGLQDDLRSLWRLPCPKPVALTWTEQRRRNKTPLDTAGRRRSQCGCPRVSGNPSMNGFQILNSHGRGSIHLKGGCWCIFFSTCQLDAAYLSAFAGCGLGYMVAVSFQFEVRNRGTRAQGQLLVAVEVGRLAAAALNEQQGLSQLKAAVFAPQL